MTESHYLTRSEWGGTWIGTPPFEKKPDGETYIHHVGGGAFMGGIVAPGFSASRSAAISIFRALNAYAQRPKILGGKGYQFLDYDLLVWFDRFNNIIWIAEGRGEYRSAATLDRNEEGEAICVCGNFELRDPFAAEIEGAALATIIGIQQGWIAETTTILGHRDNPAHPQATACPGGRYYVKLPVLRTLVADLLQEPEPVPTPPPPSPMEVEPMVDFEDIRGLWIAPDPAAAAKPENIVWFNTVLLKVGAIADVQRQNGLKVTGLYDAATATKYNQLLATMKAAAGA